jgi:hypothetical protein
VPQIIIDGFRLMFDVSSCLAAMPGYVDCAARGLTLVPSVRTDWQTLAQPSVARNGHPGLVGTQRVLSAEADVRLRRTVRHTCCADDPIFAQLCALVGAFGVFQEQDLLEGIILNCVWPAPGELALFHESRRQSGRGIHLTLVVNDLAWNIANNDALAVAQRLGAYTPYVSTVILRDLPPEALMSCLAYVHRHGMQERFNFVVGGKLTAGNLHAAVEDVLRSFPGLGLQTNAFVPDGDRMFNVREATDFIRASVALLEQCAPQPTDAR